MSTVTVSSTPVAPYTWASASFGWTAPEAGKAWQDAWVLSFDAEAAEDLGVAVGGGRSADRPAESSLALSEERRAGAPKLTLTEMPRDGLDVASRSVHGFEHISMSLVMPTVSARSECVFNFLAITGF